MDKDVELFLEDLGLIPSSLVTPTVIDLITKEWQLREFDLSKDEKRYRDYYLNKLRERSRLSRKHKQLHKPDNMTIRINFREV